MEHKIYSTDVTGTQITIEIGKLAEQANGSCTVRCGDTVVFVATTASEKPREGIDFFPLSVDFEEKLYSVGRIPGGFVKREGKPTEKAILTSRLIDRPLRPLFPKGYRNDVSIVAMALSVDPEHPPDVFAMLGSSIALGISDIPFLGPVGAVAVGLVDDTFVVNPNSKQRSLSKLNLVVAGTKDAVLMVEAGANELTEDQVLEAIMFGHGYIKQLCELQDGIIAESGKPKKDVVLFMPDTEIETAIKDFAFEDLKTALYSVEKQSREDNINLIREKVFEEFIERFPGKDRDIKEIFYNLTKEIVRTQILFEGLRPDGRTLHEVRPIESEVGFLPRVHGSGLFKRGQTQVLTTCTLGVIAEMQMLDGLWEEDSKRYIHHYNFPSYSVGETKSNRGPGRREIGHGALAERALEPVIPSQKEFPYTLRLVSEVLSSNGSSSQASVCGSTLALMDAGVPIKAPVAGVAMGLIKDESSDQVAILTDIQGLEDSLGDMDFKVAGTANGITAIQMDIKIKGIDREILKNALAQALAGRTHILAKMLDSISQPNQELSKYAPKILTIEIPVEKIRDVIGPGGKVINKIIAETGVKMDIEDDGRVFIYSVDIENANRALKIVQGLTKEVQVGELYTGKVTRIMNFGAFVELLPGKEGLVHISKLAHERVAKVEDIVAVGDEIKVKVTEIDDQGRINLSRKAALPPSSVKRESFDSSPSLEGKE